MSPTGDLNVTAILLLGDVALSLLRLSYVLPWPGTLPGAAPPNSGQPFIEDCSPGHDAMPIHMAMVSETVSFWRVGSSKAKDK